VTERQLKREFEIYGEIVSLKMVTTRADGKPRGYAFIEFATEEEMKAAFRDADAKKINGRRIVVDVERGRTVEGWRPRRMGGGLGQTRAGGAGLNRVYSGRDPRAMPGGGTTHDADHRHLDESLPRKRDRSPSPRRRDADRYRSSGYHDRRR
jgi:U1 small nuclear ribonucleoprotein